MRKPKTKAKESCPACWSSKHACERQTPSHCCETCACQIAKGVDDHENLIMLSDPFPEESTKQELLARGWQTRLSSLDTQGLDVNVLVTTITTITTRSIDTFVISVNITGSFTSQNLAVTQEFDRLISNNFSKRLSGRADETNLVRHAALAGGYLAYLWSMEVVEEEVKCLLDGVRTQNHSRGCHLDLHLKNFLINRLRTLIEEVMLAFQPLGISTRDAHERGLAYAAAAVLHREIKNVLGSPFSNQISNGPEGPLKQWLISLERELASRFAAFCGKFPRWRSVIRGSMEQLLRRRFKPAITTIHLQQKKTTSMSEEEWNSVMDMLNNNTTDEGIKWSLPPNKDILQASIDGPDYISQQPPDLISSSATDTNRSPFSPPPPLQYYSQLEVDNGFGAGYDQGFEAFMPVHHRNAEHAFGPTVASANPFTVGTNSDSVPPDYYDNMEADDWSFTTFLEQDETSSAISNLILQPEPTTGDSSIRVL